MTLTCYFALKHQTSKVTVKILFFSPLNKNQPRKLPHFNTQPAKRIGVHTFELGGIILEDKYHVIWIQLCTDCALYKVRSQVTYRCKRHLQSKQLLTCSS